MGYSDEDHLSKTHLHVYKVSDTDSRCFSNIVGQANFAQTLKRQLPTVFHYLIGGGGEFKIMISLIFNQSLSQTYLRAVSHHCSNFLLSKIKTHMHSLTFCKMSTTMYGRLSQKCCHHLRLPQCPFCHVEISRICVRSELDAALRVTASS